MKRVPLRIPFGEFVCRIPVKEFVAEFVCRSPVSRVRGEVPFRAASGGFVLFYLFF